MILLGAEWTTIESDLRKQTRVKLYSLASSTASEQSAQTDAINGKPARMVICTNSKEDRPETCKKVAK